MANFMSCLRKVRILRRPIWQHSINILRLAIDADIGGQEFDLKVVDRGYMRMAGVPEA